VRVLGPTILRHGLACAQAIAGWHQVSNLWQAPDGRWGGAAWNHGWDSTMHALLLLRDFGLDPASDPARRAVSLVRDRVTWAGMWPEGI